MRARAASTPMRLPENIRKRDPSITDYSNVSLRLEPITDCFISPKFRDLIIMRHKDMQEGNIRMR